MKYAVLFLLLAIRLDAAEKTNLAPGQMFTPDIVLYFGKQLKLTDEQIEFIRGEHEEARRNANPAQEDIAAGNEKLARLMAKSITGENEAVALVERVTKDEVKVKLIQWRMYVRIKNQLNDQQRKQLERLAKTFDPKKLEPSPALRKRIESKIAKVQKGMRELAEIGVSPESIGEMLKGLDELFAQRKFEEAEALIDQALKKLDDPF